MSGYYIIGYCYFVLLGKYFSEEDKAITKVLCCAEMLFIYSCTVEERDPD